MKKVIVLLFFVQLSAHGLSQVFFLQTQGGFGGYGMEELREWNEWYLSRLPIQAEAVDEYPGRVEYKFAMGVSWDFADVGFSYGVRSTGARYSMADYSGEYRCDYILNGFGPGLLAQLRLGSFGDFQLLLSNDLALLDTKLVLDESLVLWEEEVYQEDMTIRSKDVIWEPALRLRYPMHPLAFDLYLGFASQINGDGLFWTASTNTYPLMMGQDPVHAQWNGVRFGASVLLKFAMKDQSSN
ncbi:MAG: hypothetical protein R2751_19100 [Bacteroidales bacterium]